MFLDTFMDDASEGIMENPIPDLEDLQLEYAVSLETAYNDFMLEGCQLEFQAICEGRTEILNEGILSSIANFFKKIWRMICKVFGFDGGGSNGGGGGGASPEYISKCRARMRKLMARPESEIRKRLESWKQIKIYNKFLFNKLWETDQKFIDHFMDIMGEYYHSGDEKDHEYDQNDSNHILEEIFKNFTNDHHDVQMPQDISVSTICSTYSDYVKSILPKETTTLYELVLNNGVDIGLSMHRSLHGQKIEDSEIDIKKAMSELDDTLDSIDIYISGVNEKMWKKIIDSCTKEVEEASKKTKPKTTAFMCKMMKEFFQIAIRVCNINRKLCASFLNTLYRALR